MITTTFFLKISTNKGFGIYVIMTISNIELEIWNSNNEKLLHQFNGFRVLPIIFRENIWQEKRIFDDTAIWIKYWHTWKAFLKPILVLKKATGWYSMSASSKTAFLIICPSDKFTSTWAFPNNLALVLLWVEPDTFCTLLESSKTTAPKIIFFIWFYVNNLPTAINS